DSSERINKLVSKPFVGYTKNGNQGQVCRNSPPQQWFCPYSKLYDQFSRPHIGLMTHPSYISDLVPNMKILMHGKRYSSPKETVTFYETELMSLEVMFGRNTSKSGLEGRESAYLMIESTLHFLFYMKTSQDRKRKKERKKERERYDIQRKKIRMRSGEHDTHAIAI
ncbi:hypothetical protein C0J52_21067, partial [Blattella germanica]